MRSALDALERRLRGRHRPGEQPGAVSIYDRQSGQEISGSPSGGQPVVALPDNGRGDMPGELPAEPLKLRPSQEEREAAARRTRVRIFQQRLAALRAEDTDHDEEEDT